MPQSATLRDAPPEFSDHLQRLIADHHPHLADARIQVQVRDTALMSDGSVTYGEVDTADNPGEEGQFDFTIWFALDAWASLNEVQRDALADHELHHCSFDADGKPLLQVHDIGEFNGIIAHYGLWWPDAVETLDALNEMPPELADSDPERMQNMPEKYQRPMQGFTSRGGFQQPQPGFTSRGGFQQSQPGFTSRGGFDQSANVAWSDPHLTEGANFHTIDMGNGEVLELCPECYRAVAESIFTDALGAMGA